MFRKAGIEANIAFNMWSEDRPATAPTASNARRLSQLDAVH
jgi:hypothetical protein